MSNERHLQRCDDPQTVADILRGTNIDVEASPDLMERLNNNDKIRVYDGTYAYKVGNLFKNQR